MMNEEEASLMIIRHAIDQLEADKKQQVIACSADIRAAMLALTPTCRPALAVGRS